MGTSTGASSKAGARDRRRFDLAVAIARPAAEVYAFLADIQDAEPIPGSAVVRMVKDPPGAAAAGTVWHESVRFAPGLWLHVDSIVTDAQPPRRRGMEFRSRWFTGHLDYDIEPAAGGSVLHQREELVPRRLLRPVRGVLERRLGPRLRQRLDEIRARSNCPWRRSTVCSGQPGRDGHAMVWVLVLAYVLLRFAARYTTLGTLFVGLSWMLLWLAFEWGGSLLVLAPGRDRGVAVLTASPVR